MGLFCFISTNRKKKKESPETLARVSRRGWMGSRRPKDEEIVASWNVQVPEVVPYPVTLKSFVVASSSCQLVPYTAQITCSCSTCCLSTLAWNTCLLGSSPSPLLAFQVQLHQPAVPSTGLGWLPAARGQAWPLPWGSPITGADHFHPVPDSHPAESEQRLKIPSLVCSGVEVILGGVPAAPGSHHRPQS